MKSLITKRKINFAVKKAGLCHFNKSIKINTISYQRNWICPLPPGTVGWKEHTASMVFLPKILLLWLVSNLEDTSKELRVTLPSNHPVIFKSQAKKHRERWKTCSRWKKTKETQTLCHMWSWFGSFYYKGCPDNWQNVNGVYRWQWYVGINFLILMVILWFRWRISLVFRNYKPEHVG